jgi:hypothetical protein
MSDFPPPGPPSGPAGEPPEAPAPGWWQASDGNWYPPDQAPGYAAAPSPFAPPGFAGYGYPMQAPSTGTNGFAIASLISSIISCGIGSILGVIFGHVSLNQMKRTGEGGRGLAIAGLVIGYLGILGIIVAVIVLIAASGDDSADFEFQFDSIVRGILR